MNSYIDNLIEDKDIDKLNKEEQNLKRILNFYYNLKKDNIIKSINENIDSIIKHNEEKLKYISNNKTQIKE